MELTFTEVNVWSYNWNENGKVTGVSPSSVWLPVSVVPGTIESLPVVKVYWQPRGVPLGVGVGVGVAVAPHAEGVAVAVGVGVGVAVGDGVPTAAAISTRPHPYTLFGGPAVPHCVEEMNTAELFKASRLAVI